MNPEQIVKLVEETIRRLFREAQEEVERLIADGEIAEAVGEALAQADPATEADPIAAAPTDGPVPTDAPELYDPRALREPFDELAPLDGGSTPRWERVRSDRLARAGGQRVDTRTSRPPPDEEVLDSSSTPRWERVRSDRLARAGGQRAQ
jgi:hypothetical protein